MRLCVSIKSENQGVSTPLEILDDNNSPTTCQDVLENAIVILKLPNTSPEYEYRIEKEGKLLDHNLSLSDNGVVNNDLLHIIRKPIDNRQEPLRMVVVDTVLQPNVEEEMEAPEIDSNKDEGSSVPWKKIDFD